MKPIESKYRPGYHFTPTKNWMNDPNGLVYFNGRYHLFFQYNPQSNDWANMSWGHASSTDLVNWTEHALAIAQGRGEEIYSGSVVVDHDNSSGFGGGDDPPLVAIYTSVYPNGTQAQSLAYSRDAGMTWTKFVGNPVLDRSSNSFRDPKVSWYSTGVDSGFWLLVAAEAEQRKLVFYRSDNLKDWDFLSEFGPIGRPDIAWECPDLFPLLVDGDASSLKWVLVLSVNPGGPAGGSGTRYFIGDFDGVTFTDETPELERWLDWGRDFYAAVSFDNSPAGRRILLGWMSNWDYAASIPTAPWRGTMSLPRELSLARNSGLVTLVQQPPPELGAMERVEERLSLEPFEIDGPRTFAGGSQYRLSVVFQQIDAAQFGLDLLVGDGECTQLRYDTSTGLLSIDRRQSGNIDFHALFPSIESSSVALSDGTLGLEVFVDRTSVEVFAQGGTVCLSEQVFAADGSVGFALCSVGGSTRVTEFEWMPVRVAR